MAVESSTTISGLNAAWPLGTDIKAEGDNHLRLIKSTLQACFTDSGATIKTTKPIESPDGAIFDGSIKTSGAPQDIGSVRTTVVTSSGTYTKPAGLKSLEVWAVGGGGGGSRAGTSGASQASAGAGGGGGGTCYKVYQNADLTASEAYTVGAGGTVPGGVGGAGGNTIFKGLTAGGGGGGGALMTATAVFTSTASRGSLGAASGGDLNIPGTRGGFGYACFPSGFNALGGGTGGSFFAPGGQEPPIGLNATAGAVATFPGGGGGGDSNGPSQAGGLGNAGANGCIIFVEHF